MISFAVVKCVLRQNEVRYWLYLMDYVVTSREMVAIHAFAPDVRIPVYNLHKGSFSQP